MNFNTQIRKYYTELFPVEALFETFQINECREISFCTQSGSYIRYLHFYDAASFREKITSLGPIKIDIGAVYSSIPSKIGLSQCVGRELVFDIDLTDYPRKCCEGKNICNICYCKIKCAVKLLEYILREELGFSEIGYVFSGRRGLHCWVFDNYGLSVSTRNNIYKYFNVIIEKGLDVMKYKEIIQEVSCSENPNVDEWFVRIDKAVTTGINHLCKMPFSIHPETLKVSVPIDPENIPELEDLPTIDELLKNPTRMQYYIDIMNLWRKF